MALSVHNRLTTNQSLRSVIKRLPKSELGCRPNPMAHPF